MDSVLKDKTWNWRRARSDALETIQSQLFLVELKTRIKPFGNLLNLGSFLLLQHMLRLEKNLAKLSGGSCFGSI